MDLEYQTMIRMFSQVIWPIARVSGLVISAPVLSSVLIPARIRIFFIFVLCWICAPFVSDKLSLNDFNGWYLVYVVQELGIGLLMGFVMQLVFQIFILGGQIISMQAGLGFAVMTDPSSKASVPLISQFYLLLVTLIFLALNGHLAMLDALIESFRMMPVGEVTLSNSTVWDVIMFSSWMFKEAVLISIPALLALLIVSLSFGIMARAAPQLNIFSLGFPISLLMGFVIMKVGLINIGAHVADTVEYGMHFIKGMFH